MEAGPILITFPLGEFLFFPSQRRPQPPDVPESHLDRRRRPRHGTDLKSASPEWLEHIEALAERAAAGVPIATGYKGLPAAARET